MQPRLLVFCFLALLIGGTLYSTKKKEYLVTVSNNIYDTRAYAKEPVPSPPRFLQHYQFEPEKPSQSIEPDNILSTHPRLFGNLTKWDCLPALIDSDLYLLSWNETIFARANEWYPQDPLRYPVPPGVPLDGNGALDVARELQWRIKHWAYAYRLTIDERWKDRIWKELLVASGNSTQYFGENEDNWNSSHWLDVGEFLVAFSYAYDWLYDAWTHQQREALMWSMISLGLKKGLEAYDSNAWFLSVRGNWNCVTNGGMIIGSLAVYHEDPTGVAQALLPMAIENAKNYCSQAVESDGTWTETPDYWHFGTQAHSQLSSALLTATSNTHGMLTSNSAFKNTSWFHIYNNGLTEKFNYGDCGPPKFTATANSLFFYGTAFNNPSYILYQHDRPDAPDPLSMLWYNPRIEGSWFYDLPLDREFPDPNSAWVSMRSSWTDIKGLFVAMKAGRGLGHQTHGNLDAGDFVLDALGERWAGELCQDNYLSPGYFSSEASDSERWSYYRCGTQGQNTIVYNDSNQAVNAYPSTRFGTTQAGITDDNHDLKYDTSFWVANLTSSNNGTMIQRGVRLLQNRRQVLIQDEFTYTRFGSQWRMHTNASVTYSNNGRTAHLRMNGKRMDVSIDYPPELYFYSQEAVRIYNEPQLSLGAIDMANPNVTVLTVDVPVGNVTLITRFVPHWGRGFQAIVPPLIDLAHWTLSSHELDI
ncbi:hypothetical protein EYB26_007048 [Talaromyces marneffei]|uniref:uncharacterized protein n=1 Tax=Talaromyces marneffei TaxID=37727 RepID=UPI0012AAA09D|nr:uncharacterized protein EYB26_007048 [Talaromyces marneffei]QGA19359.1 hypothetical protein EYB26_007048 [Talaromyces marneffei]